MYDFRKWQFYIDETDPTRIGAQNRSSGRDVTMVKCELSGQTSLVYDALLIASVVTFSESNRGKENHG